MFHRDVMNNHPLAQVLVMDSVKEGLGTFM